MEQVGHNQICVKWYEYAILVFLILWSGGGFTYGLFPTWMIVLLPVLGLTFFTKRLYLKSNALIVISIVLLVFLLQSIKFGGTIISIIRPICVFIICAMYAQMIGNRFPYAYINVMYKISTACLVLWIICLFPPGLSFLRAVATKLPLFGWELIEDNTNVVDTLYIFSIPRDFTGLMRNSGPFFEPGRFTIFLNIAIAINLFFFKEKITSKKNLVLVLTNITTFSTTGYIAFAIILLCYVLLTEYSIGKKVVLSFAFIVALYYVFQLDFMAEKIIDESENIASHSRFGAFMYHLNQISQSPIIGYGPYLGLVYDDLLLSPNGLSNLMRSLGIPTSMLLYCLLYQGTKVYISQNRMINIFVFMSILSLCFSQTITDSPFFYLLYFMAFNNPKNEK